MAAYTKTEFFDSLQKILLLLNEIERKKNVVQKSCKGYHNLFKPWAMEKEKNEDEATKKKEECKKNVEDAMSAAEKAELDLVNKLLVKAEKAYKVKEKIAEPKRPSKNSPKAEDQSKNNSVVQNDERVSEIKDELSIKEIREGSNNTCLTEQKIQMKYGRPVVTKNISVPKSVVLNNDKNKNNINNRAKPKVEVKKPPRQTQSHVKAPFQTNPSIPFPKKSTSITQTAPKTRPQSASRYRQPGKSIGGQDMKKADKKPVLEKKNLQREGSGCKEINKKPVSDKKNNDVHGDDESNSNSLVDVNEEINTSKEENSPRGDSLDNQDNIHQRKTSGDDLLPNKNLEAKMEEMKIEDENPAKKKFSLLTDGSSITIPGKLKKLASHNRKLRQKLEVYRMTKKVDNTHSSSKIQAAIESRFTDIEEWTLMKNFHELTNIYRNLKSLLCSLDLDYISESSSPYEILRSRKTLEFILSTFQQVEEQRMNLDGDCIDNADYIGTCIVQMNPPKGDNSNLLVGSDMRGIWLPPRPAVIQYRSVKQLERYTNLMFQIQYLQLQSRIHDYLAQDILPFLKSLHPKSSEFIQLLRSAFSLLTDDTTFPVMVRDTIQELEDSVIGDSS